MFRRERFLLLLTLLTLDAAPTSRPTRFFAMGLVDDQTGRGVPMVELRTTNGASYYTDSSGVVAFDEPGLMDRKVFFGVSSHGYEFPADGFGIHGVAIQTTTGGRAQLKIKRLNIAKR